MAVQMLTVSDLKKMQSVNPETVDRSASRRHEGRYLIFFFVYHTSLVPAELPQDVE